MPHWKANGIVYRLQFSTVCLLLCTSFVISKLTLEEKKLILKKHNTIRQRIMQCSLPGQPPVKGYLQDLVWHEGLASKAAEKANRCVTETQPHKHHTGSSFASVGQIVIGNKGISHAIDVWINQYKKYDFVTNSCKGSTCLGYLQMVRETTKYVGCAVHECSSNPHYKSDEIIVCNYGPNGKINTGRPYVAGTKADCHIVSSGNPTKSKTRKTSLFPTRKVAVPLRPSPSTEIYWTANIPGSATPHVSRVSNKPLPHPMTTAPATFGPILVKNKSLIFLTKAHMRDNIPKTRLPKAPRIQGKPASYTTTKSPIMTKPVTVATKSVDPSFKNSTSTSNPVLKHLITSTTYPLESAEQSAHQSISTTPRHKYTIHNIASALPNKHYFLVPLIYVFRSLPEM
ncbi:hypothetical protein EG68_06733 [Paragonimus skrjabini miyazakii]|uniref:SCP domain-containing protein n=1 Tax=Paragonimus skrjabini miyazakii TaxID=59628 RepID=A0A8S9YTK4_9TREM|nr:hypothetical protein EG68_06733 [Paragonimus skrjabini miyazakii]